MKTLKFILSILAICLITVAVSFGADATVVAPATATGFQSVISWMVANQVIVGMLLIGVLDFIFAINPAWQSNNVAHMIYLFAMKIAKKDTSTTPTA
jgi:hypothetical protein